MQVVGDHLAPSPVEDAAGAAKCLGGQGSPGPGKFRGALLHASSLYGIHPGNEMVPGMFSGDRYWDLIGGRTTEGASTEMRADIVNFFATTYGSLCIGSETVLRLTSTGALSVISRRPPWPRRRTGPRRPPGLGRAQELRSERHDCRWSLR